MDTQEQIIASALKLPFEQCAAIVNALVASVQQDAGDQQALDRFLSDRISSAQQGQLSEKSFADIKRDARLDN